MIHGGFSRLPVYLQASANNRSTTVLECFLSAVSNFGLPSRVRCDKGGENVKVSEFMLNHPDGGPGRGSCITGRSVHNQRLWRDQRMRSRTTTKNYAQNVSLLVRHGKV